MIYIVDPFIDASFSFVRYIMSRFIGNWLRLELKKIKV